MNAKKKIVLAVLAGSALFALPAAQAHDNGYRGKGHWKQGHHYRHPGPRVVYSPAPVYYYPPAPVVYAPPPPVYYAPPRPVIFGTLPIGDARVRIGVRL